MAAVEPLKGRIAIITGGSGEIGAAIAAHLAALGAHVAISYSSNPSKADLLAAKINASSPSRAISLPADVTKAEQVKNLFDAVEREFGGAAHVLVACAGILNPKYPPIAATSEEDWDRIFAVNAKGTFLCIKEAANRLSRGGGGRIIAISSVVAKSLPPGLAAYAASKAAAEAAVKILAKELGGTEITANCVAPGPTATELFYEGLTEEIVGMIPMGWLGKPEEIAEVVGFLASDAGGWVNGQVIGANGSYI